MIIFCILLIITHVARTRTRHKRKFWGVVGADCPGSKSQVVSSQINIVYYEMMYRKIKKKKLIQIYYWFWTLYIANRFNIIQKILHCNIIFVCRGTMVFLTKIIFSRFRATRLLVNGSKIRGCRSKLYGRIKLSRDVVLIAVWNHFWYLPITGGVLNTTKTTAIQDNCKYHKING